MHSTWPGACPDPSKQEELEMYCPHPHDPQAVQVLSVLLEEFPGHGVEM